MSNRFTFCSGKYFLLFFLFTIGQLLQGQNTEHVVVRTINVTGNKKTKTKVVNNELDIKVGDTISLDQLDDVIERNKKRLLSTGLFSTANVNIKNWSEANEVDLLFELTESWYIYPSLILEYADRSFNVWWKEQNFALDRVNYGVRLDHLNLTGNKDRIKLKFQRGYIQKYELEYALPYLRNNWGGGIITSYSENKEIAYKTQNNLLLFYKDADERIMLRRFRTGIFLSHRTNAYINQKLRVEIHHSSIDTLVSKRLNPNYFLDGGTSITFPYFEYNRVDDRRVFPTYPEGGYLFMINFKKYGITKNADYNNLSVESKIEGYHDLGRKWYIGGSIQAKANLFRNKVAFANNSALGFGTRLRGYELYVIDGTDAVLFKSAIRKQLFSKLLNFGKYMPIKQFKLVPFAANIRLTAESGYVYEPTYIETNELNNRWLVGGGPALDLLLYNNYIFSIEYNFNHLRKGGLYLQSSFNF